MKRSKGHRRGPSPSRSARAALAARLLERLDTEIDEDRPRGWDAEIARRLEEIDSGKVEMVPLSEARRQMSGTFGARDEPRAAAARALTQSAQSAKGT